MKKTYLIFILSAFCLSANAQLFSKITGKRNNAYRDSILQIDYAYVFPIMGDKVRKGGYSLPKPGGVMLGTYWQQQELTISNLSIGLGDGDELVNIDDWTEFESITTKNMVYTVRPDVWIFPFLNVYGTLSRFHALTDAHLIKPIDLKIPTVEKTGNGVGFGSVLTYGFGPIWISENFTMNWSRAPGVDKPTQSVVNQVRIGTAVTSRDRKHFGTVWVGTSYQNYVGSNTGVYDMTQLLPDEKPRLEALKQKIEELQDGYEDFCQQPGNKPACIIIDNVLDEVKDRIDDKLGGIEKPDALLLRHGYNVQPKYKWNMLVGAQYTFNKNWEARFEAGFWGRQSFMLNVNRRFGLIKKKEQKHL